MTFNDDHDDQWETIPDDGSIDTAFIDAARDIAGNQ
jgi:hypothetical protein